MGLFGLENMDAATLVVGGFAQVGAFIFGVFRIYVRMESRIVGLETQVQQLDAKLDMIMIFTERRGVSRGES
jgi:hypothetical protein